MNSSAIYTALGLGNPPERPHLSTADDEWRARSAGPVVAPLPHLGFIAVTGPDAPSFVHGLLTNDVLHQRTDVAQLNALCQPKGRMLASFIQWRRADADGRAEIVLALSRELVPAITKRLAMFVLRAKVKVVDVSEDLVAFGWMGAQPHAPRLPPSAPSMPVTVWGLGQNSGLAVLRVPDALGARRCLIVAGADAASATWETLAAGAHAVGPSVWRLAEIHAGIPRIVAATQESFIPQMVNFELLGGVNFKKGCYPGQEVVARSQYLGKLRRRMWPARAEASGVVPGADVLQTGVAEPVGVVVNAEPNGRGGTDLLIETTLAASGAPLSVAGVPLTLLPLPYALPAEQSVA